MCSIFFSLNAQSSVNYKYVDIFNSSKCFLINLDLNQLILDGIGGSTSFCSKKNKYFCFYSKHISFAIPRGNFELQKEWVFKNIRYRNEGKKIVNFLDNSIEIYNILVIKNKIIYSFLYSKPHGLIAIGLFDSSMSQGRTYLLVGKYGFAFQK